MANEKLITLDNLRRFKQQLDEHGSGGSGLTVLALTEEMGILTDEQYALIQRQKASVVLSYSGNYYFLAYEDPSEMWFVCSDNLTINENDGTIGVYPHYFTVETDTKTYELHEPAYTESYDKNKIDELLAVKEDTSNKVTSLSADSTNTQYPSAKVVFDNFVNVREVAEGKCKTFVLRYSQTIEFIKDEIDHGEYNKITDLEGNDITDSIMAGDYDGITLDNSLFNSQNDYFDLTRSHYLFIDTVNAAAFSGQGLNVSILDTVDNFADKMKLGDIFLVEETEVPDRWISLISFDVRLNKMETAKVDISNMVTTNTDQAITGVKTFKGEVDLQYPTGSVVWKVKAAGDYSFYIQRNDSVWFSLITTQGLGLDYTFYPINTGKDLGKSAAPWNDLYLSNQIKLGGDSHFIQYSSSNGKFYFNIGLLVNGDIKLQNGSLTDGTNSVTVANISNGIFNVINASDIVNNTLTADQFAIFSNGRPTRVVGTILGYDNGFILHQFHQTNGSTWQWTGLAEFMQGNNLIDFCTLQYDSRTGVISIIRQHIGMRPSGNGTYIMGKALPAYPANVGTFGFKSVDGALSWVQEWYGTQAEYDALGTYDSNTIYNILES